ncbi:hypothetical protein D3C76_28250 [compost metagenome]
MFVSSKKHNALLAEASSLRLQLLDKQLEFKKLVDQWNELVNTINEKGGQSFLDGQVSNTQLSQEEIKTLIQLCHPDKHAGKESAKRLTQKLLTLRN